MKVLILASNPRKDLNLDREIRDLRDVIESSRHRQAFEVEDALAVRVSDLQQLLFKHEPQIVHFCGHGSGQQGLIFQGDDEREQWVQTEALSELFRLFSSNVGCVLLNACYSDTQANAIVDHVDYVIGMNQAIQDNAAIAFSKGFYRALGYNRSIEQAFEFGCNAIQLEISDSAQARSNPNDPVRKNLERKVEAVGEEAIDAITQLPIPEHLKPTLKINSTLLSGSKEDLTIAEQPLSEEVRTEIRLAIEKSLRSERKSPTLEVSQSAQSPDLQPSAINSSTVNSIITTAIVSAIANLSEDRTKDCYNALKAEVSQKFGEGSDIFDAIIRLEKRPDSEARKASVKEEVEISKANEDPEILQLAQDILESIKGHVGQTGTINQTQTNSLNNVTVSGNFEFKPTQEINRD